MTLVVPKTPRHPPKEQLQNTLKPSQTRFRQSNGETTYLTPSGCGGFGEGSREGRSGREADQRHSGFLCIKEIPFRALLDLFKLDQFRGKAQQRLQIILGSMVIVVVADGMKIWHPTC